MKENSINLVNGYMTKVYEDGYEFKEYKDEIYVVPNYRRSEILVDWENWENCCYRREVGVDLLLDFANLWRKATPKHNFNGDSFKKASMEFYTQYGCLKSSERIKLGLGGWKRMRKGFMTLEQLYNHSYGYYKSLREWAGVETLTQENDWDLENWPIAEYTSLKMGMNAENDWNVALDPELLLQAIQFEQLLWITNERMNTAKCNHCEDYYIMARTDAKFCSDNCRVKAHHIKTGRKK